MKNGFYVFKSTSLHSPCDLVAMHNGKLYKIEVTTGIPRTSGGYSHLRKEKNYDYDILALIVRQSEVVYLYNKKVIDIKELGLLNQE